MTITPELFAQAGEALFGPEWKRPLAELLGMNERTVFRIAKAARDGEPYPVSPTLAAVLAGHLRTGAEQLRGRADAAARLAEVLEVG